ncbi:MAG TPA: diguanylate cyclase [Accumulibacter sp.]|jgi:diguanylate cyclase (GGDEF)-like protein/hemerythrin-like metal-binding protein|nr:diguanylate cyclase [Accumulibacter sp.]HQC79511.1 diguanylate cyclase [Accumulibacter sp.]
MEKSAWIEEVATGGFVRLPGLMGLLTSIGAGVGVGVKSLDGCYRWVNPELRRLLCAPDNDPVEKSESDFLPARTCRLLAVSDQRLLAGETMATVEINLQIDGRACRYVWIKFPLFRADNGLAAIVSVVHDVALPRDLEDLRAANHQLRLTVGQLEQAASTDLLTGAWNRRRLEESVRIEMDRLNRYRHPLSVMIFDIDFFKTINDSHGHGVGDDVLRSVAATLKARLRKTDSLTRWGGEEFVVLCPHSTRASAAVLAERLCKQIATTAFPVIGNVTVSVGVAECQAGESWEQWFERADKALYLAKENGRNQVQLAPEVFKKNAALDGVIGDFVRLQWHAAYECGNELIDRGHRQLFANANELLAALLAHRPPQDVDSLIDQLLMEVYDHFRDEEAVIVEVGFPAAAEHILAHRELGARAENLIAGYRIGTRTLGAMFEFLAYEVITKHMLGADRLFFEYLESPPVSRRARGR